MMPAIELSKEQKQNWIEFRKFCISSGRRIKKNMIQESEVNKVMNAIERMGRDFTYNELLNEVKTHPVILKRILAILKERGRIKKISNKYWRMLPKNI